MRDTKNYETRLCQSTRWYAKCSPLTASSRQSRPAGLSVWSSPTGGQAIPIMMRQSSIVSQLIFAIIFAIILPKGSSMILEKIKALREKTGLSQEQFAHRSGVSFAPVNRWGKGHTKPRGLSLKALEEMEAEIDTEANG